MEEPGELQSMGLRRVGHNLATVFGELTKVKSSRLYPQTFKINLSRGRIQESAFFFKQAVSVLLWWFSHSVVSNSL